MSQQSQTPCTCKAYEFPHRARSGRCFNEGPGAYCGGCGQRCTPVREASETTKSEFGGAVAYHTAEYIVSDCCSACVYRDANFTISY